MKSRWIVAGAILGMVCAGIAQDRPPAVPPEVLQATKQITAAALRKHVNYLASDKLKGRANGTPGLDEAGDYIAAEFAAAGLQPAGADKFFQPTDDLLIAMNFEGFRMKFSGSGRDINVAPEETLV